MLDVVDFLALDRLFEALLELVLLLRSRFDERIFRCIIARLFRRLVKRIPRNMNRLPTRQSDPRAYFALLATLNFETALETDAMVWLVEDAWSMRSLFWQTVESSSVQDLLAEISAPAAELSTFSFVLAEYML